MSEPPVLCVTLTAHGVTRIDGSGSHWANTSLEEERREVLESVMEALSGNSPDPDEMAACRHLLLGLADAACLPGRRSR